MILWIQSDRDCSLCVMKIYSTVVKDRTLSNKKDLFST